MTLLPHEAMGKTLLAFNVGDEPEPVAIVFAGANEGAKQMMTATMFSHRLK